MHPVVSEKKVLMNKVSIIDLIFLIFTDGLMKLVLCNIAKN
tara:strand:- start:1171 stop:1293 length:123 start_codon:yes stop_codon:yes gene_type:complete